MIYLDTSVALATLLSEDTRPEDEFWQQPVVSSRLLEFEAWNRLHRLRAAKSHGELLRRLLDRVGYVELQRRTLERALDPFPVPVRTLDALHLASAIFLIEQGVDLEIATYDARFAKAAQALDLTLAVL